MKQHRSFAFVPAFLQGLEKVRLFLPRLGKIMGEIFQPLEKPFPPLPHPWKISATALLIFGAAQGALDYTFSTLAGQVGTNGSANGTGTEAQFYQPGGIVMASNGTLYVADSANHTIRAITAGGTVTTFAGSAGVSGTNDGTGAAARFSFPQGLAVDSSGNLFVADTGNSTIRMLTPAGVVTTVAGSGGLTGTNDGTGAAARFLNPYGVAVDSSGNLFVSDTGNDTIRKISPLGAVTTLAGQAGTSGSSDGAGDLASFFTPTGIIVDGSNHVFVADTDNSKIRLIDAAGNVSTFAGATDPGNLDGHGTAASFSQPYGLALDAVGNLYVADKGNGALRRISPTADVTTSANSTNLVGGIAPQAVAVDSAGHVFLADTGKQVARRGDLTGGGLILVQANNANAGSVNGAGLFPAGSNVQLTATASNGWGFASWNDGNTNSTRTISVASSAIYTANFGLVSTVTVLISPTNAGSGTGDGAYIVGSNATLTASASNGWQFASWNATVASNPWQFAVSSATTCTAYFIPARTEIIFQDDFEQGLGNWTVSGSGARWGVTALPAGGTSVWCAADSGGACAPWGPAYRYANDMDARLERTLDLRGYTTATLRFDYKLLSESGHDFLKVYLNGVEALGRSGYANWCATGANAEREGFHKELDLTAYCGQAGVTMRFAFESDNANDGSSLPLGLDSSAVGALLDNVLIFGSRNSAGQKALGVSVKGKLHLLCCGQSNMGAGQSGSIGPVDGYGTLPAYLQAIGTGATNCLLHHAWLDSGITNSYGVLRALNDSYWGPELTMGDQLAQQLSVPIYISKWASGGSDLANIWRKGVQRYYTNIVSTAAGTSNVWPAAGSVDAFVWVQGESDTPVFTSAYAYEANLRQFIADVRADLNQPCLPFVILGLSEKFQTNALGSVVWQAQQRVAATDPDVFFVAADGAPHQPTPQDSHFTSDGYQEIGRRLASNLVTAVRVYSPAIANSLTNDAQAISSSGLACWLPCESTNLVDVSSANQFLTNINLYAQSVRTNGQGWLRLGNQGALKVGTNLDFNSSSVSMSLWIYSTSSDNAAFALGNWSGSEWPLSLATILHTSNVQDGRPQPAIRSYGNYMNGGGVQGLQTLYMETRITTGCWHHIGLVLDRAEGSLTTYLNGTPAVQQTGNFSISSNLVQCLWLGSLYGGDNRTQGYMRHPMLWPRTLTREEMWSLYQLQLRGQRGAQVYQVTVQANPAQGGTASGTGLFMLDATPQISATASNGWGFLGWSDGNSQATRSLTPTDGSASFTANFGLLATINVVANTNVGGSVTGSGTFFVGSNATLTASASNGWQFLRWNDGSTNNPRTVLVSSGGATYTAVFAPTALLTVQANPTSGGSVTGGGTFVVGSTNWISATASNVWWRFINWNDGNTNASRSIVLPAGGATCIANFAALGTVAVFASPTNAGSLTGGGTFVVGSGAALAAAASNGWVFLNWNGSVTNNPWLIIVTNGATVCTANFARVSVVTVVASPTNGGTVIGGGTYLVGSNAVLAAMPANNWGFGGWDDGSTSLVRAITVPASNSTYTATFLAPASITAGVTPPAGGSVTGGGTYSPGTNITLLAIPNSGWGFLNWTDGTSNNPRIVTVPAGGAGYTARFASVAGLGTALDAPQLTWGVGGSTAWAGQAGTTHGTASAAQSGAISAGQQTWIQTTTNGPLSLLFWWKVSSAANNHLQFYINTQLVSQISGNVDWSQYVTFLGTTNQYTLKWVYTKASATISGSDAGWVDQVTVIPCPYAIHVPQLFFQESSGMIASWVVETNGAFRFARVLANTGGWALKSAGDIDGDGVSDLLFQNTASATGGWFLNADGSVRDARFWFNIGGWEIKASGDYEGLGRAQVFFQTGGGDAAYWRLDTTGAFVAAVSLGNQRPWSLRGAGDLDGDHKVELFWQNSAGVVAIWWHNPDGSIRATLPFATGEWALRGVADVDADGVCDLLWQTPDTRTGGWFMQTNGVARDARFWWPTGGWQLKAAGR
jgi:sugar lactone lactonase YvrE